MNIDYSRNTKLQFPFTLGTNIIRFARTENGLLIFLILTTLEKFIFVSNGLKIFWSAIYYKSGYLFPDIISDGEATFTEPQEIILAEHFEAA